jgi:hypothetical protein
MNVSDAELRRILEERDGPLGTSWRPHREDGVCHYRDLYPNGDCPWCLAEQRRTEQGLAPAPMRPSDRPS